jgi:hypothetical protein
MLMLSLTRFYSLPNHINKVISLVDATSDRNRVSLRLIDWFVTNYSRTHNIVLNEGAARIDVYQNYRTQLKAYSKHQFDPFRRRDRIMFHYVDSTTGNLKSIETTVGQLNFFRWMIENRILDYVEAHTDHIEADMVAGSEKKDVKKIAKVARQSNGGAMLVNRGNNLIAFD